MNFNSILIGSEDPARLADYYTKLFGKPTWDDGGYSTWLLGGGAVSIGPHSEVPAGTPTRPVDLEHREQRRAGRLRSIQGRRCHGRARAIWVRRGAWLADRDLRRPGRQLLPAHDPDGAARRLIQPARSGLQPDRGVRWESGTLQRTAGKQHLPMARQLARRSLHVRDKQEPAVALDRQNPFGASRQRIGPEPRPGCSRRMRRADRYSSSIEAGSPACRSAAIAAKATGCGNQGRAPLAGPNPNDWPSASHGSGTRAPSRPRRACPERSQMGSASTSSGRSRTSQSPSSSPW